MADTIGIVDPQGKIREIPFDMVPQALQAGGQYATPQDKARANIIQQYPKIPAWLREPLIDFSTKTAESPRMPSGLEKISKPSEKINEAIINLVEGARLPSIAGGALQAATDIPISLANIPATAHERLLGAEKSPLRIPHLNLQKNLPKDLVSNLAFLAGELGTGLGTGAGAISKFAGKGVLERGAAGALGGFAAGETGDDQGRELAAFAGGALPVVAGATQRAIGALRPKKIAEDVIEAKNLGTQRYSSGFEHFFDKAENRNIPSMIDKRPPINVNLLYEAGNSKYLKSLKDFYENPTIRNAHDAQMDLFKYLNSIPKTNRSSVERQAYQEAQRLRNEINHNTLEHLHQHKSLDLALELNNLKQGYKQDVVPYIRSKAISDLEKMKEKGGVRAKTVIDRLLNDEKFLQDVGRNHPDLLRREKLTDFFEDKPLKTALKIGGIPLVGALAGGYLGKRLGVY